MPTRRRRGRRPSRRSSTPSAVRALIWAYLRSELYPEDPAWTRATAALAAAIPPIGRVESK
ncbi:hypothetical protein GCM10020001_111460 [Nonomuraea salmonea]